MIVLDVTIVNVALPSIKSDLGFSATALVWVRERLHAHLRRVPALGGRLGDFFGHRRLFLLGIAFFTTASLVCGLVGLLRRCSSFVTGRPGSWRPPSSRRSRSPSSWASSRACERAKAMGVFGS